MKTMTVTLNSTDLDLDFSLETDMTFEMATAILNNAHTDSVLVKFDDKGANVAMI